MENTELPEEEEPEDLYKALAEDYPPEIVAPYGFVLPIPEVDFNEDWHTELKEKGYKLYPSSLRGHMVILVKDPHNQPLNNNLKKTQQEAEVPVSARNGTMRGKHKKPKSEPKETVKEAEITVSPLKIIPKTRKRWTKEEEQTIRRMIEEGHQQREIAEKLGRTLNSVLNHLQVMRGQRNKGKWLDIEKPKTDLQGPSMPKSDPPETNEVFKELLMVAGQLYPNYKSVIRILLNEASKALG